MMIFLLSTRHQTASYMVSSWSRDYTFSASSGSSFRVAAGDGKGGVGTRITYFYSKKVNFGLDGGDFVSS